MEYFKVERTKKGFPAAWENGGAYSNTGTAVVISDSNGDKKTAIATKHSGHLACGNHALFALNEGDYVCKCLQWRGDYTIRLLKLGKDCGDDGMEIVEKWAFDDGEWDKELPNINMDMIDAAMHKSNDYHCRSLYYGIEKPQKVVA